MNSPRRLPRFNPPGNLEDLTEENKGKWSSQYISHWMNDEISGLVPGPNGIERDPLVQFFNGTVTAYDQTSTIDITWDAFPAKIKRFYTGNEPLRWKIADSSRILQDEYLEYKILSVVMTCEGPEYWSFLGDAQPDDILPLYQKYNPRFRDKIMKSDLFLTNSSGCKVYDPRNCWNLTTTSGTIAHLIQPANTLMAEIDIAAQATVIRKDRHGETIDDANELINCSQYGNPYRNSDPFIGSEINNRARQGDKVSIADPVALYIREFKHDVLRLDMNGANSETKNLVALPEGTIKYERGSDKAGLRLRIQIPDGTTGPKGELLTVSDIWDTTSKHYISYGAQFADHIKMGVRGVKISGSKAPASNCPPRPGAVAHPVHMRN